MARTRKKQAAVELDRELRCPRDATRRGVYTTTTTITTKKKQGSTTLEE